MITNPVKNPQITPRFPSYKHQEEAVDRYWQDKYHALFWEMGLGKTKVTIEQAAKLYLSGEIDGVLILAPKGAFLNWIIDELPKHIPVEVPYRTAYYRSGWKSKERRAADSILTAQDNVLDFFAVNVEALSTVNGFYYALSFIRNHYTMVVLDESTIIKSPQAKRTKAATQLSHMCDYRRILTGTPITQGPLDLFSQLEFLGRGLSGHRSYTSFRAMYAITIMIDAGVRAFPKVVGYQNQAELSQYIKRFSDRKTKAQCLDLPDKVFETLYVKWTPEQERVYRALRDSALVEFKAGLATTTSALTTLTRLHQINCGHIPLDDGGGVKLIDSDRVPTLISTLELIHGKVIIWARFREDIKQIVKAISENFGAKSVVHYYGGTNTVDRVEAISRFRNDPDCLYFVANAASAGKSLTLIEAKTSIYYSLSYSLEEWLQSQDRNHRIGQTEQVTYISMVIPGTVDEKVYRALSQKRDVSREILDSYRELLALPED